MEGSHAKEDSEEWNNKVGIICRQTIYSEEEAANHLQKCNGNVEDVLDSYIDVPECTEDKNALTGSVNQEIFKQIRNVMDTASRTYRESKGLEEIELRRQEEQKANKASMVIKEKED